MRRSTKASTVAASCGVKYFHPPGVTAVGGSAAPGVQGSPPLIIVARTTRELNSSKTALDPSSRRRFGRYTGFHPDHQLLQTWNAAPGSRGGEQKLLRRRQDNRVAAGLQVLR